MADEKTPPAAAAGGVAMGVVGGIFLVVIAMGLGVCLLGTVIVAGLTVLGSEVSGKFETIADDVQKNRPP